MMTPSSPSVSVIIPCYNHGRYLAHAVRSVLAQSYTNWEAIIVDDGSTDETHHVAAQFTDARIRYIHQRNQGLAAARNAGILAAQGRYLAFLDADDEWAPGFLDRCTNVLDGAPHLVGVYTQSYMIDPEGNRLPQSGGIVVAPEHLYERLLVRGFFTVHAVLVTADVVKEVGMFDTNLPGRGAEDWDLWLRIACRYPMIGLPEPLAGYRIHPVSMATNVAEMHASRVSSLAKVFGAPDGDANTWFEQKRKAYAFAYFATVVDYLQQRDLDAAWTWLRRAAQLWPPIVIQLDTYYELVLGDQPRGYRGDATLANISINGVEMVRRLDALFVSADPSVQALQSRAYGTAHLALAMLSDQAGNWKVARQYLWQGIRWHPALLSEWLIIRRLLKLSLGKQFIGSLRPILSATRAS